MDVSGALKLTQNTYAAFSGLAHESDEGWHLAGGGPRATRPRALSEETGSSEG